MTSYWCWHEPVYVARRITGVQFLRKRDAVTSFTQYQESRVFDALKLLGSMAESRSSPSAGNRFGAVVQQGSGGGMLQQIMAQLGGGAQQGNPNNPLGGLTGPGGPSASSPAQGGLGGMLGNFAEMAKRAAGSPRQELGNNNPAAVGGLGALAGALMGGGRGAMGGGLMAVLGSLAYSALQNQGAGTASASPVSGAPGPMAPNNQADMQRKATLLVRAMIQAAKADGQVDQQETQRIMGKLDEHGHDNEARDFVASEMRHPIDIAGLARDVTTPQEATEVYAASLMAIEVDAQAELDYLADLARALNLPSSAVTQIHSALGISV